MIPRALPSNSFESLTESLLEVSMVRLRIALGVASSLVAIAALITVFAGTGQAQGNIKETNVNVLNTPLPVSGNVTATLAGDVNATISNPLNNPVLIRDVDAQGAKTLWQEQFAFQIAHGTFGTVFNFPLGAPAGKALVIEHMHLSYRSFDPSDIEPPSQLIVLASHFGESPGHATQESVPQRVGDHFVADSVGKFYVPPGQSVRVLVQRGFGSHMVNDAIVDTRLTGYLVDYP
jgi:hypothetical protein